MKKTMNVLFVIIGLLILWTVISFFVNRSVASPQYSVVEKKDGYEIRLYEPYITAQVEVTGTYDEALGDGFRILADYIFGNNTKQEGIAMTAPVTEESIQSETVQSETSEKISMTAPVLVKDNEVIKMTAPVIEQSDNETRIVSFVMPFEYTMETLPLPNNDQINIVQQEARKVAVHRFSWFRSSERVAQKKARLISMLERDGITPKSTPEYAGYNAPLTAPWLNRNEVMVEVE